KDYRTIEDVFTRKLKPEIRPNRGTVVSPADGFLSLSAPTVANAALQVKGLSYDLQGLMGQVETRFAWFCTIYLAPHNYHRVHSPIDARLTAIRYIPGSLWPVNQPFVRHLPRLFSRNERLIFELTTEHKARVYVAMVGAL